MSDYRSEMCYISILFLAILDLLNIYYIFIIYHHRASHTGMGKFSTRLLIVRFEPIIKVFFIKNCVKFNFNRLTFCAMLTIKIKNYYAILLYFV